MDKSLENILETICNATGMKIEKVKSKSRLRNICLIRHLFIYYAYNSRVHTYKAIGEFIRQGTENEGEKYDHTSAIHAVSNIRKWKQTNDTQLNYYLDKIGLHAPYIDDIVLPSNKLLKGIKCAAQAFTIINCRDRINELLEVKN